MSQTFSQFKSEFYSRLPDLNIFNCDDFNILKVVLDGLVVDYVKRGIRHDVIFKNDFSAGLILSAKRIKHRKGIKCARLILQEAKKNKTAPYLLFDNGRIAENNKAEKVSYYFNKIKNYLGKTSCFTIYQKQNELHDGAHLPSLKLVTLFSPYSKSDLELIQSIKNTYSEVQKARLFTRTELLNIRVALNKFFDEYRLWASILESSGIKVAFFDQHYHREGFMLALKRFGIKAVELQHGLIAQEDIFYIFPAQVKEIAPKALFPDVIMTYGSYWSDLLRTGAEFEQKSIEIVGLYQEISNKINPEENELLHKFLDGNDFVLITTQTYLHEDFISYTEFLSRDLLNAESKVKIIVKIHPSEKPELYGRIAMLDNVLVTDINTEYLLQNCRWHISGYSTTLYDALRYNCSNYSLTILRSIDYIKRIVGDGISVLIPKNYNPVFSKSEVNLSSVAAPSLFANFDENKHKLMSLL